VNHKRLLILDDDPMVGRTMEIMAESAGFSARFVTTPADFFLQVETWVPTHIALDLVMPEMDGVEVMSSLAEHDCDAGIIITSGVGDRVLDAARRAATGHGLNIIGVLSKPFSAAALTALLSTDGATFTPPEKRQLSRRPYLPDATDLGQALDAQQLAVHFQPKVECASRQLAGFEALVRWQHPEYGPIEPDRFIPLAEDCGLIDRLTEQVLEQSMNWFAALPRDEQLDPRCRLRARANAGLTMSVNMSARTLSDLGLIDRVVQKCNDLDIHPSSLIFELTETSAMDDPVKSLDLLTRMRMKGFHLSIDDFGTGFSSMVQLARLPFSEIKVDKSFVMTAMESRESRTVIRSIVELGHGLGLRCTAEGVETPEALDFVTEVGCDLAQGYFIARPMAGEDILRWITEKRNG
jgi:EAL domain-containing protein (putative c-di-GMP-specific phosphodiesterase class I)/ActR/RegA family two-component response regulator